MGGPAREANAYRPVEWRRAACTVDQGATEHREWAFVVRVLLEEARMRSLLIAICAAAAFALWVNGARADILADNLSVMSFEATGIGLTAAAVR